MEKIKKVIRLIYYQIKNPAKRLNYSLFAGITANLVYLGGNLVSAVGYKSIPAISFTFYHLIFLVMRIYLVHRGRRPPPREKTFRVCLLVGILLFILDILALVIIIYTIRIGGRTKYSGAVLFFFLCYAVYSLTSSGFGMKKWKNDNNNLHFTAKSLSFASALMSVFNLQFSVISTLGIDSVIRERLIFLGGFSVFLLIFLLSLRLVLRGRGASLG